MDAFTAIRRRHLALCAWFFVQTVAGERVAWRYGYQSGYHSGLYARFPESGVTVVVLANRRAAP